MTCTQCFQKIAPSTLEKSCKGEHRQQGEGEGQWEFPRVAEGVWGGGSLPSSGFFWASSPDTAHSPPQADPELSPRWRADPCAFVDVEGARSHGPAGQSLSLEVGSLEGGRGSVLLSCSWCWELGRNLFPKTGPLPSRCVFLVLQSVPLIFQEPCEQLARIRGAATERPVVKAYLPLCPSPICPMVDTCSLLCLFLIAGTGIERFWKLRKMHGSLL